MPGEVRTVRSLVVNLYWTSAHVVSRSKVKRFSLMNDLTSSSKKSWLQKWNVEMFQDNRFKLDRTSTHLSHRMFLLLRLLLKESKYHLCPSIIEYLWSLFPYGTLCLTCYIISAPTGAPVNESVYLLLSRYSFLLPVFVFLSYQYEMCVLCMAWMQQLSHSVSHDLRVVWSERPFWSKQEVSYVQWYERAEQNLETLSYITQKPVSFPFLKHIRSYLLLKCLTG